MKRFLLTLSPCLALLAGSAWLLATPTFAGSYTVNCSDGTTRTCGGTHCAGNDSTATERGYCQCSSADGGSDTKYCPPIKTDLPEDPPVS